MSSRLQLWNPQARLHTTAAQQQSSPFMFADQNLTAVDSLLCPAVHNQLNAAGAAVAPSMQNGNGLVLSQFNLSALQQQFQQPLLQQQLAPLQIPPVQQNSPLQSGMQSQPQFPTHQPQQHHHQRRVAANNNNEKAVNNGCNGCSETNSNSGSELKHPCLKYKGGCTRGSMCKFKELPRSWCVRCLLGSVHTDCFGEKPETHPCLRVWRSCRYGDACIFKDFPRVWCLYCLRKEQHRQCDGIKPVYLPALPPKILEQCADHKLAKQQAKVTQGLNGAEPKTPLTPVKASAEAFVKPQPAPTLPTALLPPALDTYTLMFTLAALSHMYPTDATADPLLSAFAPAM